MSIEANITLNAHLKKHPCASINYIIQPELKNIGDFSVRRILPSSKQKMVGPWIFFDHFGPVDLKPGHGVNIRPHPHINLATVTYLFEGEIYHRDSLGYTQAIQPSDINLMVAGKGIVHSERERPEVHNQSHRLHGLQLWLALPEAMEEIEPAFYHYKAIDLPTTTENGVEIRVMMGSAYDLNSPVKTFAKTLYAEAHLQPQQTLILPDYDQRAVYVVSGKLLAQGTIINSYEMAIFDNQKNIKIQAAEESRIVIIGGETLTERHIYWNFVSSRKERIEQAKQDWRTGKFPSIPGDNAEFIPLPD